jgi:nitroreductase
MQNNTNKFSELVKNRKTSYEFTNKKISTASIKKLITAAMHAPSFENYQPWKFIIIKDKARISSIMNFASYGVYHSTPDTVIIAVLDMKHIEDNFESVDSDGMHIKDGAFSVAIAGNNIALQAEELGIASCIISFKDKELNDLLKIPKQNSVIYGIGLGYEKKNAFQKEKEFRKYEDIVSYEHF